MDEEENIIKKIEYNEGTNINDKNPKFNYKIDEDEQYKSVIN